MRHGDVTVFTRAPSRKTCAPAASQSSPATCQPPEKAWPGGSEKRDPLEQGGEPGVPSVQLQRPGSALAFTPGRSKMWTCEGRSPACAPPRAVLFTPVVSKTSISVHSLPLSSLPWNHHDDEIPLEPERQRISK